jgi:adenylate cyclase
MAEEGFKRKLAAILSADVEGYSRLMDDDEEATVRTLKTYRSAINDLVQQYRGRIVDSPGDNILAEFTSVVDAVNCAVEIQRDLAERNTELAYNRQMQFRIGVNLGDVIEDDDNIYGDGVNIAARVESLAEAGGICISGRAYDQVLNKLGLEYENLGEHEVKNISVPIRVYRVLSHPGAAAHRVVQAKETLGRRWRNITIFAALAVVIIGGLAYWQFYMRQPAMEPASVEKLAFPLPDKPSIAVLAFDNLSGDPEQEYFSDGLSEEIINALSKSDRLFVIARNSSFTYKDKPVNVKQISRELGVRYVLEGSVRKSEDRVRITAQLIDATTGHHLWSERYDRDLKDIFAVQDEITMKIITALQVKLTEGEQMRMWAKGFKRLDVFLKSMEMLSLWRKGTHESVSRAGQVAQELIDMAPELAIGYIHLGWYHYALARGGVSPRENLKKAYGFALKAISLDESEGMSHALLGRVYTRMRQHEKGIAAGKRAIKFNPNGAEVHSHLGWTLIFAGRPDEAIEYFNKAIRLNPFPPFEYHEGMGFAYLIKENYEKAIAEFNKALQLAPMFASIHVKLSMAYSLLGQGEEARASAEKALELAPILSVSMAAKTVPFKNQTDLELFLNGMRKAGFPEGG